MENPYNTKIATKKELVDYSVNCIQAEVDRFLRESRKGFFDGNNIVICLRDDLRGAHFSKLLENADVYVELINRYRNAGWAISVQFGKDTKDKNHLTITLS